jgi:uncharacterized integral membrane protein
MSVIKWLLIGVIFVVLLVFCVSNNELVDLRFLTTHLATWPLWVVALAGFAVGFFTMYVISLADNLKLRSTIRGLRRDRRELDAEVQALRNLPLEESEAPQERREGTV